MVDCIHALQKNKDQKANKVKRRSHKTGEENPAQDKGEASEEGDQEEAIEEEGILEEGKSGQQEENPSRPPAAIGVLR